MCAGACYYFSPSKLHSGTLWPVYSRIIASECWAGDRRAECGGAGGGGGGRGSKAVPGVTTAGPGHHSACVRSSSSPPPPEVNNFLAGIYFQCRALKLFINSYIIEG